MSRWFAAGIRGGGAVVSPGAVDLGAEEAIVGFGERGEFVLGKTREAGAGGLEDEEVFDAGLDNRGPAGGDDFGKGTGGAGGGKAVRMRGDAIPDALA